MQILQFLRKKKRFPFSVPRMPPSNTNSQLVNKISVPSVQKKSALLKALARFDVVRLQFQIPHYNTDIHTESEWHECA